MEQDLKQNQPESAALGNVKFAEPISGLIKFGGYGIIEASIEGAQNLNQSKPARKKIFLTDETKSEEKEALKNRLKLILELLSSSDSIPDLIDSAQNKSDDAQLLLNKNLKSALNETRDLEIAYRSANHFFVNTGEDKLKNIKVMNASMDQLTDLDNTLFIDAVSNELKANFDRLDLRNNYSLLVIPGYLRSKKVVDKWARIASKHKVMLITDFEHLEGPDDVIDLFTSADLTGADHYLSNVMMTTNYLVGRGRQHDVGETDDVFVPASTALAGKIYGTLMSQVAAGPKFGSLNEVDGVRFPLKKSEITQLEKIGLIPMVNEFGKVMPFSAKTLFNGDNIGLQTYSVVRVFDYVAKVLIDFLNRRAFENWSLNNKMDLQKQIVRFLDSITGPKKLIVKFKIMRFEQDPKQKDRIYLDIHMLPYFPAKNFLIKLDGHKGDDPDSAEWQAEYAQNK